MQQITPLQLHEWLRDATRPQPVLIDVREGWEVDICKLPRALHLPMNSVPSRLAELDDDAQTVVICHHGGRSMQVAAFLERNGFHEVYNLSGGMDRWSLDVDGSVPRY